MELYDSMIATHGAARLQRARVTLVSAQHSWVSLPAPLVNRLLDGGAELPLVLRVIPVTTPGAPPRGPPRYVAWAGAVSATSGALELASGLATALSLPAGTEVALEPLPGLASAAAVEVEPAATEDWEVLELNAGLLEDVLLGQAGVVRVGQPFPLWARQARVMLRVRSVTLTPGGAASAGYSSVPRTVSGPTDVARLTAGTELHVAPKPRVSLPAAAAAAAVSNAQRNANSAGGQTGQQQQQQQPPVWLRVAEASHRHLLDTVRLQQQQQQQQQQNHNGNHDASSALGSSPAVRSWTTAAVFVSADTARDCGLVPGQLVRVTCSSSGSSPGSGGGGAGGGVLPLPSLTLALLLDNSVAWGHVALSPPLRQVLALVPRRYVSLQPLPAPQQLQQMPAFVLHPLLPSSATADDDEPSGRRRTEEHGTAGLGSAMASVVARASSSGGWRESSAGTAAVHQRTSVVEIEPVEQQEEPAAPVVAGEDAARGRSRSDSFTGLSLVHELLTDVLQASAALFTSRRDAQPLHGSKHATAATSSTALVPLLSGTSEARSSGADTANGPAAAAATPGDGSPASELQVPDVLQQPQVVAAAMHAWLQLQSLALAEDADTLAAVGATAAAATAAVDTEDSSCSKHQPLSRVAVLPCSGPLLVHFSLQHDTLATGAASIQRTAAPGGTNVSQSVGVKTAAESAAEYTADESVGAGQEHQQQQHFLLLLLPQLSSGHRVSGAQPVLAALPLSLLLGSTAAANGVIKASSIIDPSTAPAVRVAGPLTFNSAAAPLSPAAARHALHLTLVTAPWSSSSSSSSNEHSASKAGCVNAAPSDAADTINNNSVTVQQQQREQQQQVQQQNHQQHHQQQQQEQLLAASDYPWLHSELHRCLARIAPRLCLRSWQAWRQAGLPLPGGPLLIGSSDGGRSWLLQLLGQEAAAATTLGAHVLKVSCRGLAGQSYDVVVTVLSAAAAEAAANCPGLLLLEDLDLLVPAASGDGPTAPEQQDPAVASRLAEWLSELMRWSATQPRPLAFAATASAGASLPACLRAAGCLDAEAKVPALGPAGRTALLLSGLRGRGVHYSGSLSHLQGLVGEQLEGYGARDVALLADRAVHAALSRQLLNTQQQDSGAVGDSGSNSSKSKSFLAWRQGERDGVLQQQQQQQHARPQVTAEDVAAALSDFVPAALWRAGQHGGRSAGQGGDVAMQGWEDVGGMRGAVAALQEVLVMPAKYGQLLAAAPLRLRTGLLLFGPPGCGKTHIVAAAVAATGARLISVKGPELLNKYIGQSEAAVRDLFSRAASAAPCVLFFDEFDSIAPPRGHDSTGVTDRVVNQLLTELDGVEGLRGVTVLAATSRPDLIDAALLRPGRLDRMVFCGLPDEADRAAILAAAARRLPLAPDVDLAAVAAECSGLTGADLVALLSEAQLLAVHDVLMACQDGGDDDDHGVAPGGSSRGTRSSSAPRCEAAGAAAPLPPRVKVHHLRAALARARPSLPPSEAARLGAVYERFIAGRDPGLSNRAARAAQETAAKHATLA